MDLVRASAGARGGLTGAGVDVALIDSGVLGVAALDGPGKLVRGPDFSEDAGDADLRGLDAFGHGSHMAGVIAGDDAKTGYRGIAPGARLVSVKVAGADGITSLVRVLAALDWVRRNRSSNGLHIRVVNLSFGVDARRSYVREPLAYAAEQLWNRGVVVVAAAGNKADGTGSLDLPAADPFLLAVGATDTQQTETAADDTVADVLLARRRPAAGRARPRHRRDLAARARLDARRGVPGGAGRRGLLPRQRHVAGRRRRLRARRAAAAGAAGADAEPGQGAAQGRRGRPARRRRGRRRGPGGPGARARAAGARRRRRSRSSPRCSTCACCGRT